MTFNAVFLDEQRGRGANSALAFGASKRGISGAFSFDMLTEMLGIGSIDGCQPAEHRIVMSGRWKS